jgi:hypothetical protein
MAHRLDFRYFQGKFHRIWFPNNVYHSVIISLHCSALLCRNLLEVTGLPSCLDILLRAECA